MSVAQIAQRIRHGARAEDAGRAHDFAVVKRLIREETEDILARLRAAPAEGGAHAARAQAEERYAKAARIALRWVHNYVELDFRSLGSYTRADLERIAAAPDAF